MLTKANSLLGTPKAADSVARIVFAKAKKASNYDYSGRAAVLMFSAAVDHDMRKAKPWYDTAQYYFSKSRNYTWEGYANLNMGIVLGKQYQFEQSVAYLLKAVRNFSNAHNTPMLCSAYSTLAATFHDFGNYAEGKHYAREAIKLLSPVTEKTKGQLWRAMIALAINYDDNGEYDEALKIHFANLKNAGTNDLYLCAMYNNIGNTYQKKKDLLNASKYMIMALSKAKSLADDYQYATIYNNLASTNLLKGDLQKSSAYADSAILYSKKSASPEKLIDTYNTAYKLAYKKGDLKSAIIYRNEEWKLKDSLLSADKAKIVYDLQLQYETEKKEKDNQRLLYLTKLKTAAQNKAEAQKRFILYGSLSALAALCAVFVLIYRNTIVRNRFAEKEAATKAVFEGEQKERIRIARDLHDSIGQMLSVVKMNLSMQQHLLADVSGAATMKLVDETITEVRNISHNLIPEELNFGLFNAIEDMCEKINASGSTTVLITIPDDARQHQFDKSNELSIYRIVQEVLGNMVKHAGASEILLEVKLLVNHLTIAIKDNGKGFDTGLIEKSTGIGWKNIAARVNLLDGKMNVQSEQLSGTTIEITIPG